MTLWATQSPLTAWSASMLSMYRTGLTKSWREAHPSAVWRMRSICFAPECLKAVSGSIPTRRLPRTVKSMIGGVEGSILDSYGGELKWDGFDVNILNQRGQQRDVPIRYGLNLSDYKEDADYSEAYTACIPYWAGSEDGEEGGDVIVVGSMVSSGVASYDGRIDCMPLDLSDKFETQPTVAQVEAEGLRYMQASQSSLPAQSIEVSFVDLRDTLEYQGIAPLLEFGLCDTVPVVFPRYGMDGYFKIVKTVYNVISERYDSMELGALSTTLAQALGLEKQR